MRCARLGFGGIGLAACQILFVVALFVRSMTTSLQFKDRFCDEQRIVRANPDATSTLSTRALARYTDRWSRRIEASANRTDRRRTTGAMARAPVLAAGGIVVRGGSKPLIAVVQRRKDKDWVLPKGKLKPDENALAAARREVIEETGHHVSVREFLGAISYEVGGRPKVVQFWRMQAGDTPVHKLMRDIKAVAWLPLPAAIEKLSNPLEQVFLRNVGRRALKLTQPVARLDRVVRIRARKARNGGKARTDRKIPVHHDDASILMAPAGLPNFLRQILGRFRRTVSTTPHRA
jgi:8-oxo-dGTP diphosphatase